MDLIAPVFKKSGRIASCQSKTQLLIIVIYKVHRYNKKNRTSYQNLLQFSEFNDRRVLIKMKLKGPYVTRLFRIYGTFYEVCICYQNEK